MTEGQLQKHIVFLLNKLNGCLCFSIYNGGVYNVGAKRFMKKPFDRPAGIPDIVGVYKGKPFSIEVKLPKGRITPEQAVMHESMLRVAWNVRICRSVDEALSFVKSLDTI